MWGFAILSLALLPLSFCSDVEYTGVKGEGRKIEIASFERFTRAEGANETIEDDHKYYSSNYYPAGHPNASSLWMELSNAVGSGVTVDDDTNESELSGLHRYYEIHDLKFQFPFYGHTIDSLAVTTGGFLYTGDLLHDRVHLTQFIAPLQADFNPNVTDNGRVLVLNTDERFTVQWDQVHNHDHLNDGPFTFQVSIFPSGEIYFVYKEIPLSLGDIDNGDHPVEVGLADAFYLAQPVFGGILVRVYEYHRVALNDNTELSNSAYILTPLPNCVSAGSCEECGATSESSDFDCKWCSTLKRCSDGLDRFRQDWEDADCHEDEDEDEDESEDKSEDRSTTCKQATPTTTTSPTESAHSVCPQCVGREEESSSSTLSGTARVGLSVGVIVVVVLSLLLLLSLAALCFAYRRPNSQIGQFLIKHRPKAWSLNKDSNVSYEVASGKAVLDEDAYT